MPERAFLVLENLRRLTLFLVEYSLLIVMELGEPEATVLASAAGSFVFWETGVPELGWVAELETATEETALLPTGTSGLLVLLGVSGVREF